MVEEKPSVDPKTLYRMEARPLGRGGYAEVMAATRREDGAPVALKRAKINQNARDRIRREIKAQHELAHPNIMPILEYDPGYRWYTMPRASGNLTEMRDGLDEESLASILLNISDALSVAHDSELLHRDISPNNILAMTATESRSIRWVVADWGLVRRPLTSTSPPLTRVGEGLGTPGFSAPELLTNAMNATPAADVYSMGRVAEWFFDRQWPTPGVRNLPEGRYQHWRMFIKACTEPNPGDRPGSMSELRNLLQQVFDGRDQPANLRAAKLLSELMTGRHQDMQALANLASAFPDDSGVFLDHLAIVTTKWLRPWVVEMPGQAAELAERMASHAMNSWGDRDPGYVEAPLGFVLTVLSTLVGTDELGYAEDVALPYFLADQHASHAGQHARTIEWLTDLEGPAAVVVNRVLAPKPELCNYYKQSGSWRPRSALLAAVLST